MVTPNLATLVKGQQEENEEVRGECGYCLKPLPENHYVSTYGGKYCNEKCHYMFTED